LPIVIFGGGFQEKKMSNTDEMGACRVRNRVQYFKILQLDIGSAHSDSANILLAPSTIPVQLHAEYTVVKIRVLLRVLESNEGRRVSTELDSNYKYDPDSEFLFCSTTELIA
jgi:hypothetical protein